MSARLLAAAAALALGPGCPGPVQWDGGADAGDADADGDGGGDAGGGDADADADADLDADLDAEADGEVPAGDCVLLGPWSATSEVVPEGHHAHPLPSFAAGAFFYVHTHRDGEDRRLFSARQQADGSLGPWQLASPDHGGGPHGFTAVVAGGSPFHFRNGHIARYVLTSEGTMVGDVELLEASPDAAFDGNRYVWDSAVHAAFSTGRSWVFHLGGFSFTGYEYRPEVFRAETPLGPVFERAGARHPADRPGKAAFVALPGGRGLLLTGEPEGDRLFAALVHDDGRLEGWTELAPLPPGTGNGRGDLFAIDRTLFAVRGSRVHAAHVEEGGGLGPFREMPSLPEDQVDVSWGDGHLEGGSWGRIGGFVYLTGPRRVFSSAISPDQPCPSP